MPSLSDIVALNEKKRLPRTLATLRGVADGAVVVDAESSNHTVEIVRSSRARILHRNRTIIQSGKLPPKTCVRADGLWT